MNSILSYIEKMLNRTSDRPFLIAIDGMCGSGKTTLATYLAQELNASVFHMDDFFLQPHQRTEARLSEPGGNVDYERFREEVLNHIADADGVTFHPFNCHGWKLAAEAVTVPYNDIIILEGSYSHHPSLGDYADVRIFSHVRAEVQQERILHRNGEEMLEMFISRWIPMEERYFEKFSVSEKADLVIRNDE